MNQDQKPKYTIAFHLENSEEDAIGSVESPFVFHPIIKGDLISPMSWIAREDLVPPSGLFMVKGVEHEFHNVKEALRHHVRVIVTPYARQA